MNLSSQDDGFYHLNTLESSQEECMSDESMEPLINPPVQEEYHDKVVLGESKNHPSSSHNFVIQIHSMCIRNETLVSKELRLVQDMVQLYSKYKAQKYLLNQQSLMEKALILLRHHAPTEDDEKLIAVNLDDEILHLTSRILGHETDLMCIKSELIEKWKDIERFRKINRSRPFNIFFTLKSCERDKSDLPLNHLLQLLKSRYNLGMSSNGFHLVIESLQLLMDADLSHCEPFLSRSSGIGNMVEVNQYRSSTMTDRFFVKLLVNGTLVYTSPRGIYEPSKGQVRFDVQYCATVQDPGPDICVQIYKASNVSPAFMLCSLFIVYPQHGIDWISSGQLSSQLLPPVSSWYHFSAANNKIVGTCVHGNSYTGYIGLTTFFTSSVNCQSRHQLNFIQKTKQHQLEQRTRRFDFNNTSFNPGQLLNFKESTTGQLFDDFWSVAEPRRLYLLRLRASKLPALLNMSDPRIPMNFATGLRENADYFIDWKFVYSSVVRQRPLVDRNNVESFITLLSRADNGNWRKEREIQRASDIVYDVGDARMSGNILSFPLLQNVLCPSARRLLFPTGEQKAISLTDLDSPSLIITIIAARNIPSRSFNNISIQQPSLRSPSRRMDDFIGPTVGFDPTYPSQENECVHPFFQVQFRGKKYFSKVVSRKSPYFKQTLSVPLLSDDDTLFSPKNLIESDDSIDMKLFDAFDLGSVDACDHHFIGDWTIPLKLLYCNRKVGGTFRLNIPEILIGYEKTHGFMGDDAPSALKVPNRVPEDSTVDNSDSYENVDWSTYLDIAVNIHPNMSQCIFDNEGSLEDTNYNEDASLFEALKKWIDDCKSESSRWIRSTVTDLEGNRWIITRYIKRLPPPHSIRKSMRHCSHFVSLLALRSSIAVLRSYSGRVSSCQQFIDLQSGDELEHAILLANFFLYLSKKRRDRCECNVFMVFGRGHSDEQVALVGTEMKDKRFLLWDALKGNVYSVKNDTWYPIVEISNLVTSSHIYLNLQKNVSMNDLSFDVNDTKRWSCFPSPSEKSLLPSSIQDSSIKYSPPDYKVSAQLESEIGKAVRESLSLWRGSKCSFRDDVSDRLMGILEELEDIKLNGRKPNIGYFTSISTLTKNREIFGFPLHFPFTNMGDIVNEIEKTEIHKSKHPLVEFAVSVRVFPYESKVMSIWVFICSLSPVLMNTVETKTLTKDYKKV